MRKGAQIPDWIPEAYIIEELERDKLKDFREEMEVGYAEEVDPQKSQVEEERVIIIEL